MRGLRQKPLALKRLHLVYGGVKFSQSARAGGGITAKSGDVNSASVSDILSVKQALLEYCLTSVAVFVDSAELDSESELVERARDAGVMAYVVKPFSIGDLVPAIEIAISRHTQMRSLADEVADLHERLETRKLIDRAKGILMQALNLSEPEAFSWIQRAAMDRRLTMKEVAAAVISPDAVPES